MYMQMDKSHVEIMSPKNKREQNVKFFLFSHTPSYPTSSIKIISLLDVGKINLTSNLKKYRKTKTGYISYFSNLILKIQHF